MKLFFIHDHPFFKEDENVYSGGGLPNSVWDNYLPFFDEIIVFGRSSSSANDRAVLSSKENVSFYLSKINLATAGGLLNIRKAFREIDSQMKQCDVVLIRLPSLLGFLAAFICIRKKKKYFIEQVGNAKEAFSVHGSIKGKLLSSVFHGINQHLVRKADFVIYVTQQKLQHDYPTEGYSTGISNVILQDVLKESGLSRDRYFTESFKIGLIGGFDISYKGQDILLRAISILDPALRNRIELYFVGKGNYEDVLLLAKELNLANLIRFIGKKESGEPILRFLSNLSLYVQPSKGAEGLPRALLEAMSVGCPALGSEVGGIPEVVNEKFLHKPGDYHKLSSQIADFMKNREMLYQTGIANLEVVKPYLKRELLRKRKEFFSKLLQNGC